MDDGARCCFDFRGRFAHFPAGDSLDLLSHRLGRAGKELAMKLLHLRGTFRSAGQGLFGRRQGVVQSHDQRVLAEDHGHRFGGEPRPLLLQPAGHAGELLCDRESVSFILFIHQDRQATNTSRLAETPSITRIKKPMWRNTRRCSATSVYFLTSPLALPGCYLSSHPKHLPSKGMAVPSLDTSFYGVPVGETRGVTICACQADHGSLSSWVDVQNMDQIAPAHLPQQISGVIGCSMVKLPKSLDRR